MRRAVMTILVVTVVMAAMQLCCQVPALAYGAGITLYGYAYQDVPWPMIKCGASYVCVNGGGGNWKVSCHWLTGKWEVGNVPSNCSYWVTAYSNYLGLGWRSVSTQVSIPERKWYLPWTWHYKVPNLLVPYR